MTVQEQSSSDLKLTRSRRELIPRAGRAAPFPHARSSRPGTTRANPSLQTGWWRITVQAPPSGPASTTVLGWEKFSYYFLPPPLFFFFLICEHLLSPGSKLGNEALPSRDAQPLCDPLSSPRSTHLTSGPQPGPFHLPSLACIIVLSTM